MLAVNHTLVVPAVKEPDCRHCGEPVITLRPPTFGPMQILAPSKMPSGGFGMVVHNIRICPKCDAAIVAEPQA